MKVRSRLSAIALAAVAFGICTSALAEEKKKGPNNGKPVAAAADSAAGGVEALRTARMLARYGDANKDALALIEAARIVKSAGATESPFKPTVASKPAGTPTKADPYTVDALVSRAKALAGGRADLVALADDVGKSGARGAVGGPKYTWTVVGARGVHSFVVNFRGGEPARVAASGDGDSDLDLYVYDENGNLMCRDEDQSDDMLCGWTPRWTGPFVIRVRNRGPANEYLIMTN